MSDTDLSLKEFSQSIESTSIEFYKTCILKCRQFSTKYILQKMMEHHKKHMSELEALLVDNGPPAIKASDLESYRSSFRRTGSVKTNDREHFNFVDATTLAITLASFQLDFYRNLEKELKGSPGSKDLDKILDLKIKYLDELKSELDRLSYDK
jgi:rubrerythrin